MFSRTTARAVASSRSFIRLQSTTAVPESASTASSSSTPVPAPISEREYAATIVHGRGIRRPHQLPKTHGIPVATLHFRSYQVRQLDFFTHFAGHAAAALGIPLSRPVHLPTQRRLWTVIRGPFAHKKSQENFQRLTHKRLVKAWDADPAVVDMFVQYLEKHLIPGIGMRAVQWKRASVGVGKKTLEDAMAGLRLDRPKDVVKALGEQIVKQEMAAAGAAAEGAVTPTASAKPKSPKAASPAEKASS